MKHDKHIGLSLDPNTNDLHFDASNNLVMVTDAHAVGQHVRQRLKTFEGEWFLDRTAGMPWLEEIMAHKFNPALAEAITKVEILDTDGVTEITSFSVSFHQQTRDLRIRDVALRTVYDAEVQV